MFDNLLTTKQRVEMNIILTAINAKYIHSGLAVYSLHANAFEYKKNIKIKEYTINNKFDDVLQDLHFAKPDILAFSCYIWNIEYIKSLIVELSKLLPDTQIWLGGPEVSYNAQNILTDYKMVKGIMIGEGENTFYKILEHYCGNSIDLKDIKGIIYRTANQNIVSNALIQLLELNDIEFAYGDLSNFENRIIYYESSRGCPFSCSYCLSSIDKQLRFRCIDKVKKELAFFLSNKVKQVKFVDRTFNCNKHHSNEIWKFLLENDNGVTNFHFEIAADLLDDAQIELLKKMRKGLVQFEIGVQTTNPITIDEIDRSMDLDKLSDVVTKIKALGNIHQHLDLIVGLPYENYESFAKSFNEVYALQPDQLQLGFLKVLRGSKMHEQSEKYCLVYASNAPYEVLYTKWISFDERCKLKGVEEALEIYYNSGQFTNTLKCVERLFESPFSMYEKLSMYLKEKDKFLKHSRINYYKILLEFLIKIDDKNEEVYKEILIYDLYLRENMKNRPDFAQNIDGYKDRIKVFYQEEGRKFNYLKGYNKYNTKQIANITHIEVFKRDIFKFVTKGIDDGQETIILYDYINKDELSNSATTHLIYL